MPLGKERWESFGSASHSSLGHKEAARQRGDIMAVNKPSEMTPARVHGKKRTQRSSKVMGKSAWNQAREDLDEFMARIKRAPKKSKACGAKKKAHERRPQARSSGPSLDTSGRRGRARPEARIKFVGWSFVPYRIRYNATCKLGPPDT